jgi:hypothetical protein
MDADMVALVTIPGMFCWFAWMIFSTIRRYKIAKAQAALISCSSERAASLPA